jgi:hypothetical protein
MMTADIPVSSPTSSKGQQNITSVLAGDIRIRITKMLSNDIDSPLVATFDTILNDSARQVAATAGISYDGLSIIDRLLMTRFRCQLCGVLPLYYLDIKYLNKIRCGKCSMIVSLRNSSGKYGRIRKRIAIETCRAIDGMLNYN